MRLFQGIILLAFLIFVECGKLIRVQVIHKNGSRFVRRLCQTLADSCENVHFFDAQRYEKPLDGVTLDQALDTQLQLVKSKPNEVVLSCVERRFVDDETRENVFIIRSVRDPRDYLISAYFSFGWTHPPPLHIQKLLQIEPSQLTESQRVDVEQYRRGISEIQESSLSDYILSHLFSTKAIYAVWLNGPPESARGRRYLDLTYSDMVNNFRQWLWAFLGPFEGITSDRVKTELFNQLSADLNTTSNIAVSAEEIKSGKIVQVRNPRGGDWALLLTPGSQKFLATFFADEINKLEKQN